MTREESRAPDSTVGRDWRPDVVALLILILLTGLVVWHRWALDNWLSRHDLLAFFIPWYGYLGDRLSDFDIPAWNPYLFSGMPFAADPESGWMYLPAMLTFPFFEVTVAFKVMIALQLLIAGITSYTLGRFLGVGVLGAMMGALAYEFGPFVFMQTDCCTVGTQIQTWIPLAFLGVELAFRARTWQVRIASWGLGGLGISQMIAAWPGQGLIYGLLMVGAWVAYRSAISPPDARWSLTDRLREMFTTGPAVLAIGLALSAAGLLPRLAFNADSNNPGGSYEGVPGAVDQPAHNLISLPRDLLLDDYVTRTGGGALSGVIVVLALLAPVLAGRRYAVPFFTGLTVVAYVLTLQWTPLHELFYLIPGFEGVHVHSPRRLIWVHLIGPTMLAGAGLRAVLDRAHEQRSAPLLVVLVAVIAWIGLWLSHHQFPLSEAFYLSAALTVLLLAAILLLPAASGLTEHLSIPAFLAMGVLCLAFIFPTGRDLTVSVFMPADPRMVAFSGTDMWGTDPVTQAAIDENLARTDPGGAGEFLQRQEATEPPFRYASYAGRGSLEGDNRTYPDRRLEPGVMGILVNGRPARLGLEQIQGYNPVQLAVYEEYMAALNGREQDYHYADLLPSGAHSQLLDMLNVRYILVDASLPPARPDVAQVTGGRQEVFRDGQTVIYENASAYPRAWIVHDVRPNNGGAGLQQLATGAVNGREVAFVDGPIPEVEPLTPAEQDAGESAVVTEQEPESITIEVQAQAPGLLVVSEIYADGWQAYVDGEQVDVLRTNHALRGVPIPEGESTVELRYEPVPLRVGLWVSGITGLLMLGAFANAGWFAWERRAE